MHTHDEQMELEIEPEEAPLGTALAAIREGSRISLVDILPRDFPLDALLTFVPDVRLKRRLEAQAAEALAIDVTQPGGLEAADAALAGLREGIKEIEECFSLPTDLANALHKRMTGLRGDFIAPGKAAAETVGQRVYDETTRLKRAAADAARAAQAAADRLAREAAARAAKQAEAQAAPAPVVEALKRQAETAVAPPVRMATAPALASTATVARWKARLAGTPGDADPNPSTADMDAAQLVSLKRLLQAVVDGTAPPALVEVNWSLANRRAAAEKTTLAVPGLEAFGAGGTRAKGRR